MEDIFQRAAQAGVETRYWDGLGQLHEIEPEVLARLLEALAATGDRSEPILPRWLLVRGDALPEIRLVAAEGLSFHWEVASDRVIAEGRGSSPLLKLPRALPFGIYRLRVGLEQGHWEETPLLVAPHQAWQGEPGAPPRMWALAVQLYGVRSQRNWGHGDFSDLNRLIDLAAGVGASGVGLNPLHAGFDDSAQEPSPYFPSSRLFLNSLYIDVEAIPEFPGIGSA